MAMLHELPPVVPPLVAATTAVTPSPEPPPSHVPVLTPPTVEQAQAADHVFTEPQQRDAAATAFGVWMSAVMLRDLAVDALHKAPDEEQPKQGGGGNDDEESEGEK